MDTILPQTPEPVTAEQLRAARSLLRIAQRDLAARAGVPLPSLRRLEGVGGTVKVPPDIVRRTRRALEQAGAVFVAGGVQRQAIPEWPLSYEEKLAQVRVIQAEVKQLPILDPRPVEVMFADLYDENGLPR
ncbi:MAG: hypothetical protein ACT6Q8_11855 [Niveispirillum sp.]|uniref:hypothetical protein n=1 Tax=Niveispirillum sp. TaxID=1917217 RepID=UPI004036C94A